MDVKTAIEMLDDIHGGLLFDGDDAEAEAFDETVFACQHFLQALADIERAKATLKLAEVFLARELAGNL